MARAFGARVLSILIRILLATCFASTLGLKNKEEVAADRLARVRVGKVQLLRVADGEGENPGRRVGVKTLGKSLPSSLASSLAKNDI